MEPCPGLKGWGSGHLGSAARPPCGDGRRGADLRWGELPLPSVLEAAPSCPAGSALRSPEVRAGSDEQPQREVQLPARASRNPARGKCSAGMGGGGLFLGCTGRIQGSVNWETSEAPPSTQVLLSSGVPCPFCVLNGRGACSGASVFCWSPWLVGEAGSQRRSEQVPCDGAHIGQRLCHGVPSVLFS